MRQLAMHQSHETFKTALPHRDQALYILNYKAKGKKKCEHKEQMQLLKSNTSSNVSPLRASFLVASHIAKTKMAFAIGEELNLPAAKDIRLLGEAAFQKVVHDPLSATIITT